MKLQQRVTPFLSFHSKADEAARFYVSIIPDSQILRTVVNPAGNEVMTVEFELAGLKVVALNAWQDWKFTNAFSFSVACDTQEEIDRLWTALTEGGQPIQCGWLTDKFGLSWQIVPANIGEMLADADASKSGRVMEALLNMVKLDIAALRAAYQGT